MRFEIVSVPTDLICSGLYADIIDYMLTLLLST